MSSQTPGSSFPGYPIMTCSGSKEWLLRGHRHRLDGPAVIRSDGSEEWWIQGRNITHLSAHKKLLLIRAYQQTITAIPNL